MLLPQHAHLNARLKEIGGHFDDVIVRNWVPAEGAYQYRLSDEVRDAMTRIGRAMTPSAASAIAEIDSQ